MSTKKKASVHKIKTPLTDSIVKSTQAPATIPELDKATDEQGLIKVNDLDSFVLMITAWHTANADMLRKMSTIPGDGGLTVEYEGKPHELKGDLHKGFLMGITTALGMFGQLPFVELEEEVPASNDEPAQPTD
jgi:hypothetical protein